MTRLFDILLITLIFLMSFLACTTVKYIPVSTASAVEYRDTTIYRDSIVVVPVERTVEVVPQLDTLSMSTSVAAATAYLDTTARQLRGSIHNLSVPIETIRYRLKTVYRDSIVTKEVPVPVTIEKTVRKSPWYEKYLWILSFIAVVLLGAKAAPLIKRLRL